MHPQKQKCGVCNYYDVNNSCVRNAIKVWREIVWQGSRAGVLVTEAKEANGLDHCRYAEGGS